ncbi:MAG: Clp1/GlmU family protein [Candidatus Nezhaarchaeota archaeon]|nr:Clp1/GlmU family protein [Candidatus Nezhaarchaeota archaeon]
MGRIKESKGTVIKVEGPASIQVLEGAVSILGSIVKPKDKLIIPRHKFAALEFVEDSVVELRMGGEAKMDRVNETLIPSEWRATVENMLARRRKPISCMILGDVDSGKTAFCTYLANHAANLGLKVGVIDKDPGQTEISVPTTIGLGIIEKPVYSLEQVKAVTARFVGSTSPANVGHRIIAATKQLYDEAGKMGCDVVVVNTSGWVDGRGARELKYNVISAIHPQFLVLIQRANEVEHLVKPFEKSDVEIIRVQPIIGKVKSKDERRTRREAVYRNYFSKAKTRKVSLSSARLMFTMFTTGARLSDEALERYSKDLSIELVYGEESKDSLFLVSRGAVLERGKIEEKAKVTYGKEDVVITWLGEERGLMAGLLSPDLTYLGLGIIREVDYAKKLLEIFTPVEDMIGVIQVGLIKLDDDFRESQKYDRSPL